MAGFSVVASEIRELANRTAASTQEISKLVASVQKNQSGRRVMQEGATIVEEGVRFPRTRRGASKDPERAHHSRHEQEHQPGGDEQAWGSNR
jgi:methyl-accepting chemotaxis protein